MSSTFGRLVTLTVSGESRGKAITVILEGIKPGIAIDENRIKEALARRAPDGAGATERHENDGFEILGGIYEGKTTGTPVCISVRNSDTAGDGNAEYFRPSHADYASFVKYGGFADPRGGGFSSGRVTAGIAAAGAIAEAVLDSVGVTVATRVKRCGGSEDEGDLCENAFSVRTMKFPTVSDGKAEEMKAEILRAKAEGDSLGGVTETVILGLPAGIGEPFFDSMESVISHAVFSVPGIKGIEFGDGFALCGMKGSEANDPIRASDGKIYTETNRSGGINGGISNGMPVIFRAAVKPTPTVSKIQKTVSRDKKENAEFSFGGRNDACIVPRAAHVINAVTELAVLDLLCREYGVMLGGL